MTCHGFGLTVTPTSGTAACPVCGLRASVWTEEGFEDGPFYVSYHRSPTLPSNPGQGVFTFTD
jgi:hypothetical protein